MNSEDQLSGVIVPVITPVDERDRVDEAAFRAQIAFLLAAGVHGLFVGGSAGEGPLLTKEEWNRMVTIAHNEVGDRVPLLVGVMETSTRRVGEKIATAREIGCRYVVLTPTYYLAVRTKAEHLRLFCQAKEAAGDIELIACNIPSCTTSTLEVETVCEMARRKWIRCCKESSGNFAHLSALIRRGRDLGLTVLAGDERTSGQALLAGAKGIVPVCANFEPETYIQLYESVTHRDRIQVEKIMKRVLRLRSAIPSPGPCWVAGVKYAVFTRGIGSGRPISPLEPATAAQVRAIRRLKRT
jgi:4-hydroxy-tetrahydrodipicolinate synthase